MSPVLISINKWLDAGYTSEYFYEVQHRCGKPVKLVP